MNNTPEKNPDHLLSLIKKSDERKRQGRLKIFLGMAAGVGKTFAMLQAARQVQDRGTDVVVGIVEHHGRKETEALLQGLAVMPRKAITYRGVEISDLDIDAVLRRRPKIVLVDELAHTNAPGSRHAKRYLDVLEILKAGIDVYTTLNVQHIESRVDTVQEITKISVHETVPDVVLDRADEIVLIDLSPEELIKRLSEGRIYAEDSAQLAAKNFFQQGNLTALREMALRVAGERVDRELRDYKTLHGIEEVWKASGRLMVAVFASPYSEVLIRWTRRVADLLRVTWIGAYVESDDGYNEDEQKLLAKNIALVQQIGGEVVSTRDDDPVKGLLRIANQNNVTQIIVGKSQRGLFKNLLSGGSVVNRLLRQSGNIDVYAVSTGRARERKYPKRPLAVRGPRYDSKDFGWTVAITLATWLLAAGLQPLIGYMAVGIVFLIAVSVSGLFLSRMAVFGLALVFASIHNFFFIPPQFSLGVSKPEDFMLLIMFFVAAAVVGHLTTRLAHKERVLRLREDRTSRLYQLAKEVASAPSAAEILIRSQAQLEEALATDVVLMAKSSMDGPAKLRSDLQLNRPEKNLAVATWVLLNGKMAGYGTETLSASEYTFIPVIGRTGVLGVAGVHTAKLGRPLAADQMTLIDAYLHQIATGIERETYHERIKQLVIVEETQKLYKALLDCVSHELKTPLAAIKGAASALLDPTTRNSDGAVDTLGSQILEGSERLQRIVENLLDMTRIESGMMRPKRVLCDVSDIVSTAMRSQEKLTGARRISISMPTTLPPVDCDPVLVNQAFSNILHNVMVYTPDGTPVEIEARLHEAGEIEILIRDHGPGLPEPHPEKVLEKFFRGDQKNTGGVGLGLSIAKGFIEAQGGRIEAGNHPDGGAVFRVYMPQGELA